MPQTFFVNPLVSVRRHGKAVSAKVFHAAGFSRNAPRRKTTKRPTARQLAARKKFAAMSRARTAAGRKKVRALSRSTEGAGMARRKRKAATRRSTSRKRRSVGARRRRVYAANPRKRVRRRVRTHAKRSRRRSYRRNPGLGSMFGGTLELAKGAVAVGVGMAASRTLGNMIPLNASNPSQQPLYDAAKGVLVAIAIKKFGGKIVGQKYADLAAIGALVTPIRAVVIGYLPSAASFLGDSGGVMAMPRFTTARRIAAYPGGVAAYDGAGMGSYSDSYPG